MKIWIASKKQLFCYIGIACAVLVFFIWLLIPTGTSGNPLNKPSAQSIVTKDLSYTPKTANRKRASDWKNIQQKAPYVLMYDKYFTHKVKYNKKLAQIDVHLKKRYVKQLGNKSNSNLEDMIYRQMHKNADSIQNRTDAYQVAIKVVNYPGFIVVND